MCDSDESNDDTVAPDRGVRQQSQRRRRMVGKSEPRGVVGDACAGAEAGREGGEPGEGGGYESVVEVYLVVFVGVVGIFIVIVIVVVEVLEVVNAYGLQRR